MATATSTPADFSPAQAGPYSGAAPEFLSLGNYFDILNDPKYTRQIQKKYVEDLDIYGVIMAEGNEFGIDRDTDIFHFEDVRSYVNGSATVGAAVARADTGAKTFTDATHKVRDEDDIMIEGKIPAHVTATNATTFTAVPKDTTWNITISNGAAVDYFVFGNEFAKGTNQPTEYLLDNVERKETKIGIMKDRFTMTGSQMTDMSRIEIPGRPPAAIYQSEMKGLMRFRAYVAMKLIYDVEAKNTNLSALNGNKGLKKAIEEEGSVFEGALTSLADFQDMSEVFDSQGGPVDYLFAANPAQYNLAQNLISESTGDMGWGMFNNDKDKMMEFGFKGLHVSGYNFALKKSKLLTNPQLKTDIKALIIPQGLTNDAKGNSLPYLSILYKQLGAYSRKYETQITGFSNDVANDPSGFDGKNIDYRCEQGLRTVAMNAFGMVK